uniref:Uncharacterized protein n=1 Tax=Anopheles melas TaxID=34690 RepID=A0A182UER7_9DIPT
MELNVSVSPTPLQKAAALARQKMAVELRDALGQGFQHVPSHRAVVVSSAQFDHIYSPSSCRRWRAAVIELCKINRLRWCISRSRYRSSSGRCRSSGSDRPGSCGSNGLDKTVLRRRIESVARCHRQRRIVAIELLVVLLLLLLPMVADRGPEQHLAQEAVVVEVEIGGR